MFQCSHFPEINSKEASFSAINKKTTLHYYPNFTLSMVPHQKPDRQNYNELQDFEDPFDSTPTLVSPKRSSSTNQMAGKGKKGTFPNIS